MSFACRFKMKVEETSPGAFLMNLRAHGSEAIKYALARTPRVPAPGNPSEFPIQDHEAFTWYQMDEDIVKAMKITGGVLNVTVHLESVEDGPYVCDYVYNLWTNEETHGNPGVTVDRYEYKLVRCNNIAERRHL